MQDFIAYFAPGAEYVGMRDCQLLTPVNGPGAAREIRADCVPEARQANRHFLIDVEWQASGDKEMAERLLSYSIGLTRLHKLSVLSIVLYIRPVGKIPLAPLVLSVPVRPTEDWQAIQFDFISLEICKTSIEEFRSLDLDAFFVLMLLCQDGGTPAVLEEVLERLLKNKENNRDSIAVAFFFAGQIFESEADRRFLGRKYAMLDETLKDNWMYQKMISEGIAQGLEQGREQGLEQGLEQGREQGQLKEARTIIEELVEDRFPALLVWSRGRVEYICDLEALRKILLAVSRATTAEEIKAAFPPQH
ncbi:MAG TPA: hypothetical protein VGD98_11275 [Ktedonobacteraceae bacterium]